jgi:hypothetical protein
VNCPNCGTSNLDNASICVNCGRPLSGAASPPPPPQPPPQSASYTPPPPRPASFGGTPPPTGQIPNYLIQSILVTLCCCLPLGVVAIIFAAQVNQKLAAGDYAGAQEASNKAKMFCWIGFGIGLALIAISLLLNGAVFLQAFREGMANAR